MKDIQSVVLTGWTLVTGALADIFPSRELNPKRVQTGDMKLWCHLAPGARVWSGQFRAAVYDGRKWRTFRLNIVADSDARYDSFDERSVKARRCFDAIAQLKGQTARKFQSGTWGCNYTLKAPATSNAARSTASDTAGKPEKAPVSASAVTAAPAPAVTAAPAVAAVPAVVVTVVVTAPAPVAARTALPPATAPHSSASSRTPRRRSRKTKGDDRQLTLF